MRRLWLILLFSLPALGGRVADQASKTLRFAADEWCPFNCAPSDGREGFVVDIVRAVYEPLGYRVDYRLMPWTRAIVEARTGHLSGLLSTPRSQETRSLLFPARPVGMMQNALFKRHGSSWQFDGLSSLDRQRIGYVEGYVFPGAIGNYLALAGGNIDLATGEEAGSRNIRKLALGHLDLIAEDVSVVRYQMWRQKLDGQLEAATPIGAAVPIYVAFPANAPGAMLHVRELDEGVERLCRSGELKSILARYQLSLWRDPAWPCPP